MSSAEAPSAAVRTITPPFFGAISLRIAFRRLRSSSSSRRETPRPVAVRDVDDEAAGQRDLGREPRALRLHRVLDGLDEHGLAALDQVLDLAGALAALELGADDLVDVEEAVLLEADLDERGLHPGQDVVDDAEVDVAGDRAALRPLEVDLGDLVVLEHGDALLARVDRDRAARASPSAAAPAWAACGGGLRGAARARLRSAVFSRAASGLSAALCGVALAASAAARVGRLLLAVAPAARAAAALLRLAVLDCPSASGRLGGGGVDGRCSGSCGVGAAAASGACSSAFLRRNQGSGKRYLLSMARAQPRRPYRQERARVAGGWEKPWHRPARRVSTVADRLRQVAEAVRRLRPPGASLRAPGADRPQAL